MAEKAANNFEVSATGGAGTSGQPVQYVAGIDRAQDFMEMQSSAPMNKSGVSLPQGVSGGAPVMSGFQGTPLTAPTERPDEHPSTGAAMGNTPGPEMLASTAMLEAQGSKDIQRLKAMLPIYAKQAESPNATNSFRNFYRWLSAQ